MAAAQTLRSLQSKLPFLNKQVVSYLTIQGYINKQTAYRTSHLLKQLPSSTSKLAVVVNSMGGDLSQTHIIAQRLVSKAKQHNIELITFAEEFALNSAFYLLVHGNKVYADESTFVGGVEVGESKLIPGPIRQYYTNVVYSAGQTYAAEKARDEPYSEASRAELGQLYAKFSQDMEQAIRQQRKVNSSEVNLLEYYSASEAQRLGLIDGVGRLYQQIPKLAPGVSIRQLRESRISKLITDIKSLRVLQ